MPKTRYQIRSARYEELPQLAAIEQRAGMLFSSTPHAYVCSGPNLPLSVAVQRWHAGFVLVAADGGDAVVGFALGGALDGEVFLQELDVDPAHGRRGLGKRLLRSVLQWAARRGYRTVLLSTFADVPWNAPFYARQGFETVPEDQITPAMQAVRDEERRLGLALASRVFMRVKVRQLTS